MVKKNRSLRESSRKKQGAQERHDGVHLSVLSRPDHTMDHMHSDCTGCPYRTKCLDKTLLSNKDEVSYYHRHKFDMEYDSIIQTAYKEKPLPETPAKKRGRKKKGKVLNLICRLDNYKGSICLFLKNLCVPFDNNQAERDLRMIKVKTKVSGCFRSEEGSQEYLTIMSYIGSGS